MANKFERKRNVINRIIMVSIVTIGALAGFYLIKSIPSLDVWLSQHVGELILFTFCLIVAFFVVLDAYES